jgi:hypothetical protein
MNFYTDRNGNIGFVETIVDTDKDVTFKPRHYTLFAIISIISIVQMVLQIIYTINIQSSLYFYACILFGPCHLIGALLAATKGKSKDKTQ